MIVWYRLSAYSTWIIGYATIQVVRCWAFGAGNNGSGPDMKLPNECVWIVPGTVGQED